MLSALIRKQIGTPGKQFSLDVQFDVSAGVTILFGASGSGKTSILKAIAGILRPDSGAISIDERVLFDSAHGIDLPIRERGIGFVFQDLSLFPHLSARQNVEFGIKAVSREEKKKRSQAMLESFRAAHVADRRPRDISGGEAQRVAFARALACAPGILLLDEPLSAIDDDTKRGIIADLKAYNVQKQLPIIYVTHSRDEAVSLGERVIVLENGRIVASGEPLEVFGAPVIASVARLTGAENVFDGKVLAARESAGMMTVEISDSAGSSKIEVPFGLVGSGKAVKVAVPSGDILLATEEPRNTSARNVLRGRVVAIEYEARRTLVRAQSGVTWSVSVTRESVVEMNLSVGREIWLAFKTHSCYLLDR